MREMSRMSLPDKQLKAAGLKRDPFGPPKTPRDVYWGQDAAQVQVVLYETIRRPGMCAITGEVGAGKTCAVKMFYRSELERKSEYVASWIHLHRMDKVNMSHLCKKVLGDMTGDLHAHRQDVVVAERVRVAFEELASAGQRPVILVEDAHLLPTQTLRDFKILYEMGSGLEPLVAIILVGQPELEARLKRENLRQLTQRTRICRMRGLASDLRQYLDHLFERAGSSCGDFFEPEAITALAASDGGVKTPLEANYLAARALLYGWRMGEARITADMMQQVLSHRDDEDYSQEQAEPAGAPGGRSTAVQRAAAAHTRKAAAA